MNPVNFLTESSIFQFEQLTFNAAYHNVSAIQTFLNNTFMKGKLPDDASKRTYAQVFYEIGKNRPFKSDSILPHVSIRNREMELLH